MPRILASTVALVTLATSIALAVITGVVVSIISSGTFNEQVQTLVSKLHDEYTYPTFSARFARTQCDGVKSLLMSDLPRVSVIIPSYRRTSSLVRAVNSVRKQTYPAAAIEIIVVDDASPNPKFYDRLQQKWKEDTQVQLHRLTQNVGQSGARNHAIKHATGKYIAFLDDDDAWLPEKVAVQVACMEAENATFCSTDGVSGWGAYVPLKRYTDQFLPTKTYNTSGAVLNILRDRFGERGIPRKLDRLVIQKHNVIITSSVMCTKELFVLSDHGFTVGKHCAEDHELWQELLGPRCGGHGLYLSVPLFYYDSGHAGGSWWHRNR
jgi:glycosyltransferase involved in cell wall biosynthesis